MISPQTKRWIDTQIAVQKSISEINEALTTKKYSVAQIHEIDDYIQKKFSEMEKPQNEESFSFFKKLMSNSALDVIFEILLNPMYVISALVIFLFILVLFFPQLVSYLSLVIYAGFVGLLLALMITQIRSFSESEETSSRHTFLMTFLIVLFAKILGLALRPDSIIGIILIYLVVSIIISILFEKGNLQLAMLSVFIVSAGLFTIDYFFTQIISNSSLAVYRLYFDTILINI